MEPATLGDYTFYIDPESASWSFAVNTKEHENVGGKVVQVLGIKQSDITVVGSFSSPKKREMEDGTTQIVGGWVEQERFLQSMISQSKSYTEAPDSAPLRFRVPSMNWDFGVRVKEFAGVGHRRSVRVSPASIVNPKWKLTLHVDADTRELRRIGADEFIKRLTKGMGWKATEYQGPLTAEESLDYLADQMLPGESLSDFFARTYAEGQGIFTNDSRRSDAGAFEGNNLQNPSAVPGLGNEGPNTTIMGPSLLSFSTIEQNWLRVGKPQIIDPNGLNISVRDLLKLYNEESRLEGVRGDWLFAQAILETGWFTSPDVSPPRRVFAGIGKTDSADLGYSFETAQLGVRAHVVFMKRVANGNDVRLRSAIQSWADGSFGGNRLTWGRSPVQTWGGLAGTYATDASYYQSISSVYRTIGGDPGG